MEKANAEIQTRNMFFLCVCMLFLLHQSFPHKRSTEHTYTDFPTRFFSLYVFSKFTYIEITTLRADGGFAKRFQDDFKCNNMLP